MVDRPLAWALFAGVAGLAVLALAHAASADDYWATSVGAGTMGPSGGPPYSPVPSHGTIKLSNSAATAQTATIVGPGGTVMVSVPAGSTASYAMVDGPMSTDLYPRMGYHIATPYALAASVYQQDTDVALNDATRLAYGNEVGTDYWAITAYGPDPNFITIVATQDGTAVTVTPTGTITGGGAIPWISPGVATTFTLNALDVLQLESDDDITGSHVQSSLPVAVFTGDRCTYMIPGGCGLVYDAAHTVPVGRDTHVLCTSTVARPGAGAYDTARVVAARPGTYVNVVPNPLSPAPGPYYLAAAGDFVDLNIDQDTVVTSDKGVVVGRLYARPGGTGNPTLIVDRPSDRYRTTEMAWLSGDWTNYVSVAAPSGANVNMDGTPFASWRTITGTGWACSTLIGTAGTHTVTGDAPHVAQVLGVSANSGVWFEAPPPGYRPPNARAVVDTSRTTCLDSRVKFSDNLSTSVDGTTITSWTWDFGDSSPTATGTPVFHLYAAPGTYSATLTVKDDVGATGSTTFAVTTVGDPDCPPTLPAVPDFGVTEGDPLRICPNASDPEGDTLTVTVANAPPEAFFDTYGCLVFVTKGHVGKWSGISLIASDGRMTATRNFTIEIVAPATPGNAKDSDDDGVQDVADDCPLVANKDQSDTDRDGIGDACDPSPGSPGTGTPPPGAVHLGGSGDADGDGVIDARDHCPLAPDPRQEDADADGLGDACDPDGDGDGTVDRPAAGIGDNCPGVPNPTQQDSDGDGAGDACDGATAKAAATPLRPASKAATPEALRQHASLTPLWLVATAVFCVMAVALPFWLVLRRK